MHQQVPLALGASQSTWCARLHAVVVHAAIWTKLCIQELAHRQAGLPAKFGRGHDLRCCQQNKNCNNAVYR